MPTRFVIGHFRVSLMRIPAVVRISLRKLSEVLRQPSVMAALSSPPARDISARPSHFPLMVLSSLVQYLLTAGTIEKRRLSSEL